MLGLDLAHCGLVNITDEENKALESSVEGMSSYGRKLSGPVAEYWTRNFQVAVCITLQSFTSSFEQVLNLCVLRSTQPSILSGTWNKQ